MWWRMISASRTKMLSVSKLKLQLAQADLDYHLTTLFPPVRPRRFLEIRYLDSVPDAVWPAVVFTLTTLLDDPVAADIAAEATEPVATAWDRAAQIGLGDRRLHEAATRCVQAAAERAPAELEESMQRLVRSVEQGRCPADDFSDRVVKIRDRDRGHRTGARGAVTARETLARGLTKARDRTLRLVEFDDAELHRQYDPLMSPLVWDLAHIGQQEELWLLRGDNPHRPGMLSPDVDRLYDAFENSRASRVDLPLLPPSEARTYCATVRDKALDTLDALPDDDGDAAFRLRAGDQPREPARRDDAAGTEPAVGAAVAGAPARRCRRAGRESAGTSVLVPAGRSSSASMRSPSRIRWTTNAPRTSSTCPPSASAGSR